MPGIFKREYKFILKRDRKREYKNILKKVKK